VDSGRVALSELALSNKSTSWYETAPSPESNSEPSTGADDCGPVRRGTDTVGLYRVEFHAAHLPNDGYETLRVLGLA
jgi:hypothetical protein